MRGKFVQGSITPLALAKILTRMVMRDVCGNYPRRARSALGVDTVLTLDVCMFVCMLGL